MSVRKNPCPYCDRLISGSPSSAQFKSHLASHTGQHWAKDNQHAKGQTFTKTKRGLRTQ